MTEQTVVFLHIPKAAGATLRSLLTTVYGEEAVFWFRPGARRRCVRKLRGMDPDRKAELRVVTGHIPYGLVDRLLSQPLSYISILRDPVDRVRSAYQFIRDTKKHPDHAVVRSMSLADYANSDLTGLDNIQTRMISGKSSRAVDHDVFDLARENLEKFALVGVQEHYTAFVSSLAEFLGWQEIPTVPSAHIAEARVAVDDACRKLICERNQWDLMLHRHVKARWEHLDAA